MSRPISWLPRVREMHRSVCNSVRATYQRCDLELLFQLQPRAVLKLIELMPRTAIGSTFVVEKDDLANFLERVKSSSNVPKLLEEIRAEAPAVKREKLRTTVRYDRAKLALPQGVYMKRGRLEISFTSITSLAEAMTSLLPMMETFEFERDYARDAYGATLKSGVEQEFILARKDMDALENDLAQAQIEYDLRPQLDTIGTPQLSSASSPLFMQASEGGNESPTLRQNLDGKS